MTAHYFRRLYKIYQSQVLAIPGRVIAVLFFLFLLLLPIFVRDVYILRIFIFANVFVIFAVSWDVLGGFTGQINFGHALFFGVAAYTAALLNIHLGLTPWLTIPLGAIVAVAAGLLVGIPALRLRGHYLALATLAFPLMLTGGVFAFSNLTGGELGLSGVTPLPGSRMSQYYASFLLMAGSVLIMWKLTDANSSIIRIAVIFHAIREDEIAARACGINTIRYKLLAFAISGFFAGVAGGFYVHFLRIAGPSTLELMLSFQAIIWTIFGGIGTIYGAVVGVYILYPLMEVLRAAPELRMFVFALIIMVILRFMPEGIAVWVRDKLEKECPRCKLANAAWRTNCRACGAALYLEKANSSQNLEIERK